MASQSGHSVRLAKTSCDAFKVLKDEIDYIDIAVIDVDPGAHGMALLEAISGREERPPVVVLTALEENVHRNNCRAPRRSSLHGQAGFSGEIKIHD